MTRPRCITIRLPDGSLFEDSEIATAERGGAQGIARGAVDPREASATKHREEAGAGHESPPAVPLTPGGAAGGTAGVRPRAASSAKLGLENALIVSLRSPHGVETYQWLCPPCIERRKRARWEVLSQRQGPLLECDDCAGPGLEQGAPF